MYTLYEDKDNNNYCKRSECSSNLFAVSLKDNWFLFATSPVVRVYVVVGRTMTFLCIPSLFHTNYSFTLSLKNALVASALLINDAPLSVSAILKRRRDAIPSVVPKHHLLFLLYIHLFACNAPALMTASLNPLYLFFIQFFLVAIVGRNFSIWRVHKSISPLFTPATILINALT